MHFLAQSPYPNLAPFGDVSPESLWLATAIYLLMIVMGLVFSTFLFITLVQRPRRNDDDVRVVVSRPWGGRDAAMIAVFVVGLMAIASAVTPLLEFVGGPFATPESSGWLVLHSIAFHWGGLLVVAGLVRFRGMTWRDAFGADGSYLLQRIFQGLALYFVTLPFIWFYSSLFHILLRWWGVEPTWQDVAISLTDEYSMVLRIYLLSLAVVVAPVVEELLFRGILLPVLVRRVGLAPAIVGVALLFGFLHFHLSSVLALMLLSVALSLAYVSSRSILVPIVMHMAFNGVSVALLMMMRYL